MRRPRARGNAPRAPARPGGAGVPPGGTRTSREELADDAKPLALLGLKRWGPKRTAPRPSRKADSRRKRGPAMARRRIGAPRGARASCIWSALIAQTGANEARTYGIMEAPTASRVYPTCECKCRSRVYPRSVRAIPSFFEGPRERQAHPAPSQTTRAA